MLAPESEQGPDDEDVEVADGFDEVFGSAISKAVRRAVDGVGRSPYGSLDRPRHAAPSTPDPDADADADEPPAPATSRSLADEAPPPLPGAGVTDPYELLGVNRRAPWPEITAAYKRRARAWHPDGANEDERDRREQLLRDLNAAYAELRVRRGK